MLCSHIKTFLNCLLFTTSTVVFLLGCGDSKKFDEMREANAAIKKDTDAVVSKSKEAEVLSKKAVSAAELAAEGTKNVAQAQATATGSLRTLEGEVKEAKAGVNDLVEMAQKEDDQRKRLLAENLRRNVIESLERSSSARDRVELAKKYLMGFEYQSFTVKDIESRPGERERLMADAIREFFATISRFAPEEEFEPFATPTTEAVSAPENRASVFNSLAMAIFVKAAEPKTNEDQENPEQTQLKRSQSIFDFITRALNLRTDVQRGTIKMDEVPTSVKEVLLNEALAIRILKTRHNAFLTHLVRDYFNLSGASANLGRAAGFEIIKSWDFLLNWWMKGNREVNLDGDGFNATILQKILNDVLQPARENKSWLTRLGHRPEFEDSVRGLAQVIIIKPGSRGSPAVLEAKKAILEKYTDFISRAP